MSRRLLPFARVLSIFAVGATAACGAAVPPVEIPQPPSPSAGASSPVAAPPPVAAVAPPAIPADTSLGQLDFIVTGSADCQRKFREGMLALHSFLYDQAHDSFAAALAADPGCSMAAWGDAMTYDHPVWSERDVKKARAALARVTSEDALSPKERAYLATARALFAKDDKKEGHAAWLAAAAAMHHDYPDDDEVALQHALALLAVYGYDRKHVREQMEAAAIALAVLQRRPEHPGAAHYAIHALDSREHAILALPAARTYARIAPAAGHAQHMPSHTFTHLGMWRDVVASNEHSYPSSVAWEKAHGHTPSKYDWHSYSWLIAAHLELGQPSQARKLIDEARALLVAATDDTGNFRASYSSMVSNYVMQTDRWDELEALIAPVFAPALGEGVGGDGPVACAMHAPGGTAEFRMPGALFARRGGQRLRAEAAIRAGDRATAEKRVADMRAVRAQMAPWAKAISPEFAKTMDATEDMLLARARAAAKKPAADAQKKALDALDKLDQLERADVDSGPAFYKTTSETIGDDLLAWGKPKEALAAFERDLDARPNRAVALLGAARAAFAAKDAAKAREHYATLAQLWSDADGDLPALAEVRAGAK